MSVGNFPSAALPYLMKDNGFVWCKTGDKNESLTRKDDSDQ